MNGRALVLVQLAIVSIPSISRAEEKPAAPAASAAPSPPAPSARPAGAAPSPPSTPGPAVASPSATPAPPTPTPVPAPPVPVPVPAAPAPAIASAPAPAPTAVTAAPAPMPARPGPAGQQVASGEAVVHLAVDYRGAWLETRSFIDDGPFVRTCPAPCDLKLRVDGIEARVVAPGMTTSNAFRFDPGSGAAGVRVDGGSAAARRAGIITLAAGIPIAMAGMALFGKGRLDDDGGLQAAGIAGLAVGGLSIGVSLPLLLLGTTHVKSAKGELIAQADPLGGAL